MEESHIITTKDGHFIRSVLSYTGNTKPERVAVIVNGFLCNMNTEPYPNTRTWFNASGIATFHFNFFGTGRSQRVFAETLIEEQISDLEEVILYLKNIGFPIVFLMAHSFAAHLAIHSDLSYVDGIVMWEPSLRVPKNISTSSTYCAKENTYKLRSGAEMKKDAFDSLINLDDSLSSIRKITCPVLVICAGNGFLIESGKELLSYNSNPLNRFRIIDGAGHFFNEEGIAEKLYCLSISWIKLCLDHQAETDSSKTEEPRKVTIH